MTELVLVARRPPPRHPGAARLGQDVDVGPADRAPARRRQARRRRLDEPQGDPQAARRGRGGRDRRPGRQEGERRQPRVVLRERAHRERHGAATTASTRRSPAAPPGCFAHEDLDRRLDYLFVDEAGQVSLADALAMGTCARNVVLVGDPQQLAQVLQGSHPHGAGVVGAQAPARRRRDDPARPRALPRAHVPPAPGRLRLHLGGVLRGTARARPASRRRGRRRSAPASATSQVEHDGRRQESPRRSTRVAAEVERLLAAGVAAAEIMVVAPYNAQVNLLRERAARGRRASARWTSSRARRPTSSSTRWRARAARTSRAGSSSCSRATA